MNMSYYIAVIIIIIIIIIIINNFVFVDIMQYLKSVHANR